MKAPVTTASGAACILLAEEVWGSTLHAMRSLDRVGVPVLVATAGRGSSIYRRSRHCTAAIDIAATDPAAFCAEVQAWAESARPGVSPLVVIPLSDRLLEYVHLHRGSFPDRFRLGIPPDDTTDELLDKVSSLRLAEAAGLDVPAWVPVRSGDDLVAVDKLRLPVAIRPTKWSTVGSRYFKIGVHRDRSDLERAVRAALEDGAQVIAQEYIDAADDAVEFGIVWRGADGDTAICTGRKRRQSDPAGGVMVWGETVALPDVREATIRFLGESRFTGVGGTEFIRSGGQLWFVEFNPRLEAIHFLAAAAGVDVVRLAFDDLAAGRGHPPQGIVQRPASAWVGSAALNRIMAEPARTAIPRILRDRLTFARSPNRVRAVWTWRDPLPGLAILGRLLHRSLRRTGAGRGT